MRLLRLKDCLRATRRAKHAFAHSLRVRLVALFLLLAFGMAIAFVGGMQAALGIGWRDAAKPLVIDYVDKLAADIGSPPSVERAKALTAHLPLSVRISGPQVNWRSNPQDPDYVHEHDRYWMGDTSDRPEEERFYERTTADGHLIQFGVSVKAWRDRPRFIGLATLSALLVLTWLAYTRVRRMLRPLDDIRAGAMRFGKGQFGKPIEIPNCRPDELAELAVTINTMGADIHQMLEAKRALLLAISHELRSPLTRARLNVELLPETPDLQPNREALLRDLALMRDLVTDLLESERLASPHVALHTEAVDLAALAHEVADGLPGSPEVQRDISTQLPTLALDPTRLRLLLRNLLDNSLRHSVGATQPPVISVLPMADGGVRISVRDFGAGVAADLLPNLGQPFYRPDAARTREGGGVGLGLYLCRLVAQAHRGRFAARNAGPGLDIRIELPGVKV
jgi:signal transduction histidine kinase